jgi:hypothetical protein
VRAIHQREPFGALFGFVKISDNKKESLATLLRKAKPPAASDVNAIVWRQGVLKSVLYQ